MEAFNKILESSEYNYNLAQNIKYEKTRQYCKHDLQHFLDVARIMYIFSLENNLGFDKETVYLTALLHDIGKWEQYETKKPHNETSAEIARDLLNKISYDKDKIDLIVQAIFDHRHEVSDKKSLSYLIYFADKKSRLCFKCDMNNECNWDSDKKTKELLF